VIFRSHLISMLIFAFIVAVVLAFAKHDDGRSIFRYALKVFLYLAGGVVVFSWFMYVI
jgi:hypothetical protein